MIAGLICNCMDSGTVVGVMLLILAIGAALLALVMTRRP